MSSASKDPGGASRASVYPRAVSPGAAAFDQGLARPKPQPVLRWGEESQWPFEVYYAEFLRVKAHLVKVLAIDKPEVADGL